jgi:hypothetical protein
MINLVVLSAAKDIAPVTQNAVEEDARSFAALRMTRREFPFATPSAPIVGARPPA